MSSFEALYDYFLPSIKEYVVNSKVPAVKYFLVMLDEVLLTPKDHLEQERNPMKQQAKKKNRRRIYDRRLGVCSTAALQAEFS